MNNETNFKQKICGLDDQNFDSIKIASTVDLPGYLEVIEPKDFTIKEKVKIWTINNILAIPVNKIYKRKIYYSQGLNENVKDTTIESESIIDNKKSKKNSATKPPIKRVIKKHSCIGKVPFKEYKNICKSTNVVLILRYSVGNNKTKNES